MVGCDGAKSLVRHQLDFTFEGNTIDALFYVANVEMTFAEPHDALYVCFGADSFVAFFPLKGENRWRIVGNLPEEIRRDESRIDYGEIENKIRNEVKMPLDITNVKWFSVYRVHSRRVDKFSIDRCFLAGDAAHIHTPAGGQGMNTGIGDAYNLAWKLAFVLKGTPSVTLADDSTLFPGGLGQFTATPGAGSVSVSGAGSPTGLRTLTLVSATNAVVNIPPFTSGTTAPVVVTFTVVNPNLAVDIRLRATGVYHGVLIRLQCGARQPPQPNVTETGEIFPSIDTFAPPLIAALMNFSAFKPNPTQ